MADVARMVDPNEHLAKIDKDGVEPLNCVVTACVENSEIVGIQVVTGSPAIGDELLCVETGRRYQIVSFGLSPNPDMYDTGHSVVLLSPIDGSMAEGPLHRGMYLIKG